MVKKIGLIVLFIGMLCHSACLDPTDNSFDKRDMSHKTLVINEIVASAGNGGNDWIELYNAGEYKVHLRDYSIVDDNVEREPVPLPDTSLEPGEFIVIQATVEAPEDGSYYASFGLGADDSVILYWGLTIVDVLDWGLGEAPTGYSYGRVPDGIGMASALIPTPGLINKEILSSDLVINEIMASAVDGGSDWIELYNTGEDVVYLEYYALVDDNPEHDPVELPDIMLEPGEFIIIQATVVAPGDGSFYVPFGLDADDSVTLYQDSDIVDMLDWRAGDAPTGYSYGRFPDGMENRQALIPTPGQPNKDVQSSEKSLGDDDSNHNELAESIRD
jgi:hypothetical protein